jgi:endo-alpha-1,4-polygalactosaminidase (GH114 family)
MEEGDADFTTHSWPGGHDNGYWDAHWARYLRFYANSLAHCG